MTTQTHQPWKPTCWVGGYAMTMPNSVGRHVIVGWFDDVEPEPICGLPDDSRAKYATQKATAAILRSMRK